MESKENLRIRDFRVVSKVVPIANTSAERLRRTALTMRKKTQVSACDQNNEKHPNRGGLNVRSS